MSEQAYPGLTKAEGIFKSVAWDSMVTGALTYFHLNFWPVNSIIKIITDNLYSALVLLTDVTAIKLMNAEAEKSLNLAMAQLAIVVDETGVNSTQYKEVLNEAQKDFARFVRFGATS